MLESTLLSARTIGRRGQLRSRAFDSISVTGGAAHAACSLYTHAAGAAPSMMFYFNKSGRRSVMARWYAACSSHVSETAAEAKIWQGRENQAMFKQKEKSMSRQLSWISTCLLVGHRDSMPTQYTGARKRCYRRHCSRMIPVWPPHTKYCCSESCCSCECPVPSTFYTLPAALLLGMQRL
jgi:hypothetical protein